MKHLFDHTNEGTAKVVDDYPWGFKLRTQQRYWLESTPKRGDRFVTQTKNPKNGLWCKPKKSTYSNIGIMIEKENGHIKWMAVNIYTGADKVKAFIESVGGIEMLNSTQKTMYNQLLGINEVKHNEFTGKVVKDYSIKWEKDKDNKCVRLIIRFDRPDGVQLKEVFKAMKAVNQDRLKEVFIIRDYGRMGKSAGVVQISTRGLGSYLGTVSEDQYKEWVASDHNEDN